MTPFDRITAARKELLLAQKELVEVLGRDKSRRRGQVIRQLHELRRMLEPNYRYSSQAGQDLVIDRVFREKTGGTFVDVGAYDGVTGSNTLFFEQHRAWTGVLVEPVRAQRAKIKFTRRSRCLPLAIGPVEGVAEFIEITEGFTQMSGLSDSYEAGMLEKVRADPRHKEEIVRVRTQTLSAMLNEAGLPDPDFISLDIEGGEVSVLKAFPFKDHQVGAWAIENNTGAPDIAEIMRAQDYELVEFCGPDEIYVHRRHLAKT